jgi:hypothetical protein
MFDGLDIPDPTFDDARPYLQHTSSTFGELTHVLPAGDIAGNSPRWDRPPVPLGTHEPAWA